ncbi:hypothetical protein WDU94_002224 [Cyamophila willieti]
MLIGVFWTFTCPKSPRCDGPTRPKNYTVNFLNVLNMPTKFHQNRTRRSRVRAVQTKDI